MKKRIFNIPVNVKITVKLYLFLLIIYFIFRLILILTNLKSLDDSTFGEIIKAFAIGIKFDTTTIAYLLAVPVFLLTIFAFIGKLPKIVKILFVVLLSATLSITFFVCGADIPYYQQFITRFNVAALNNMKDGQMGTVVMMILEEPAFIVYIIPVVLFIVLFVFLISRIFNKTTAWERGNYISKSIYSLLLFILVFFGMRGRFDLSDTPITCNDSFFCSNHLLNQLGLNPNYVLFVTSTEESYDDYFTDLDDETSLEMVKNQLNIHKSADDFPLSRYVQADTISNKYNVVLVLMESMKSSYLAHGGNNNNLTPCLDSLCDNGLYFNNFYTQNTRTCYGIFSTLTGYPSMYPGNPLYSTPLRKYESLPSVLKSNNYSTAALIPHDKLFDNINGFFYANDFDRLYSVEDYPEEEQVNSWGVPDDVLFEHALDVMNDLSQKENPFFVTIITVSNHAPYILPADYQPRASEMADVFKEVEYADFSIEKFLKEASEKSWFDSTLFVFLADHGLSEGGPYPMSLPCVHVPLIFYSPSLISPENNSDIASQIDVFPTIMGLLNVSYNNSTFGIDLRRESRKYAYFMNGNKYGIIDDKWFYTSDLHNGTSYLYHYADNDKKDYSETEPAIAKEMRLYGISNWRTAIMLNDNRVELSRFIR